METKKSDLAAQVESLSSSLNEQNPMVQQILVEHIADITEHIASITRHIADITEHIASNTKLTTFKMEEVRTITTRVGELIRSISRRT
jgi:methyl-accepting chemotaxis protein